jgi:hypothetical protein
MRPARLRLFVIAGDLHRSCGAAVARRERALFLAFAIVAIKPGRSSRSCNAICNRGEESSELVERTHI